MTTCFEGISTSSHCLVALFMLAVPMHNALQADYSLCKVFHISGRVVWLVFPSAIRAFWRSLLPTILSYVIVGGSHSLSLKHSAAKISVYYLQYKLCIHCALCKLITLLPDKICFAVLLKQRRGLCPGRVLAMTLGGHSPHSL